MADKPFFNLPPIPIIANSLSSSVTSRNNSDNHTPLLPPIVPVTQHAVSSHPRRRGRPPKNPQIHDAKRASVSYSRFKLLEKDGLLSSPSSSSPSSSNTTATSSVAQTTQSSPILSNNLPALPVSSRNSPSLYPISSPNLHHTHSLGNDADENSQSRGNVVTSSPAAYSNQLAMMLNTVASSADSNGSAGYRKTKHDIDPVPETILSTAPGLQPTSNDRATTPVFPKRKRGRPRTRDIRPRSGDRVEKQAFPELTTLPSTLASPSTRPSDPFDRLQHDPQNEGRDEQRNGLGAMLFGHPQGHKQVRPSSPPPRHDTSLNDLNEIITIQPAIIVTPSGVAPSLRSKGTKERRKAPKKEHSRKAGNSYNYSNNSPRGPGELLKSPDSDSTRNQPKNSVSPKRRKTDPLGVCLGVNHPSGLPNLDKAGHSFGDSRNCNQNVSKSPAQYLSLTPVTPSSGDRLGEQGPDQPVSKPTARISVLQLLSETPDVAPPHYKPTNGDESKARKAKMAMGVARMLARSEEHRIAPLVSTLPAPGKRSSSITSFVNDANAPLGATRSFTQPQTASSPHLRQSPSIPMQSMHSRNSISSPGSLSLHLHNNLVFSGPGQFGSPSSNGHKQHLQGYSAGLSPKLSANTLTPLSSVSSLSNYPQTPTTNASAAAEDEPASPVVEFQNYQIPPSPSLFPPILDGGSRNINKRINGIGSSEHNGIKTGKEDGYFTFPTARKGYVPGPEKIRSRRGRTGKSEGGERSEGKPPVQEFTGFPGFNGFNGQGLPHLVSLRSFSAATSFYVTPPSSLDSLPSSLLPNAGSTDGVKYGSVLVPEQLESRGQEQLETQKKSRKKKRVKGLEMPEPAEKKEKGNPGRISVNQLLG